MGMSRPPIRDEVLRILGYSETEWGVPISEVDAVAYMEQGWVDSVHMVGVLIDIEEIFGVELTPEDTEADAMRTVGGLISAVERHLSLNEGGGQL